MKLHRLITYVSIMLISCATTFAQDYLGMGSAQVIKEVEKKTDDYAKSTSGGFDQIWFGTSGRNGATYFLSFNKQQKCFIEHIITTSKEVAQSFIYDNFIVKEYEKDSYPEPNGKIVLLYQAKRNPFGGVNYSLYIYNDTDMEAVKSYLSKE